MYSVNKKQFEDDTFNVIEVKQENIEVTLMDFGATVLAIKVPDKDGKKESVLMDYKELSSYLDGEMYLNGTIGPTSGRIGGAYYEIDGAPYYLESNFMETENLHGGSDSFAHKYFDFEIIDEPTQTQVIFSYRNLESGSNYPGNQNIQVIYTIKDTELKIEFLADTSEPTLMNITNHMYFNLSGNLKRKVLDNKLWINSSKTIELNDKFIPVNVQGVDGTHLDFRKEQVLSEVMTKEVVSRPEKGIDNPMLLDEVNFTKAQVLLKDPISKRKMEMYTTYPSVVVYTHNHPDFLDLAFDVKHEMNLGICFEAQNPPNGVNIEGLESSILREGEQYYHKTLYKFGVMK